MPEEAQQIVQDTNEEGDEFKVLWTDAREGADRFEALADAAEKGGHPEIAKVYREIKGSVLSLIVDLTMATGGAIINLQDEIDEVESKGNDEVDASVLLPEDSEKYVQLFEQYVKLFDGLSEVIPAGSEGDKQREIFATLRRMTVGMIEFTRSITADAAEPDDSEGEDEPDDPETDE